MIFPNIYTCVLNCLYYVVYYSIKLFYKHMTSYPIREQSVCVCVCVCVWCVSVNIIFSCVSIGSVSMCRCQCLYIHLCVLFCVRMCACTRARTQLCTTFVYLCHKNRVSVGVLPLLSARITTHLISRSSSSSVLPLSFLRLLSLP